MTNGRDNTIDIAKAIGIILVVFGHTQSQYIQIVYQFHLPLFFFLSGMVFNEKKAISAPRYFVVAKIKGLYWPFVKFELIFLVFHNLFSAIGLYSNMSNVKLHLSIEEMLKNCGLILTMGYGEQLAGPLWFLISSFEIVIIFFIIVTAFETLHLSQKKSALGILAIGIIAYAIGSNTHLPRMMSQSLIGLFFFCMGFLYKAYKTRVLINIWGALISAVIVGGCYFMNSVDISKLALTHSWMLPLSGIAGTYLVLWISKKISKWKCSFLNYCGKNTLYVLALHCIAFKLTLLVEIIICGLDMEYLGSFPTFEVSPFWCIPFTITGVVVPLAVKKFIDMASLHVGVSKQ